MTIGDGLTALGSAAVLGGMLGAGPPAVCSSDAAQVRAVRAVATGIVTADNARDLERVLGFYASDAILLPPGEAPVAGIEAIRPRYIALFEGFMPEIEARVDEACVSGEVAFVRGHNGGRLKARGAGPSRPLDDAYLMLLRRNTDGAWRISHLMWHRAGP
jgi:uncharacterized protein (TIGR02246 family)